MSNLIQNYEIILDTLQKTCSHIECFTQIRKPKLSNLELVALNLTAEYMSINSELQLFRDLKHTYLETKIERTVYNKRKRKLFSFLELIRSSLSESLSGLSTTFIVDSTPLEICKYSRANRSSICSTIDIKPTYGYCAATKTRYFGYKLHAVCDENGIIHSFDFTPANIHDIHYLKDIKNNLKNCTLIGDKGYLSADYQLDLFNSSNIKLSVPMRKNQTNFQIYCPIKRKKRKRIETIFSQLDAQFTMVTNFAKTFSGFKTRILSKITAFTMIQNLNYFVFNRELNKVKVNLF